MNDAEGAARDERRRKGRPVREARLRSEDEEEEEEDEAGGFFASFVCFWWDRQALCFSFLDD